MNEADTCRKHVAPKLRAAGWEDEPHSPTELKPFTQAIALGSSGRRAESTSCANGQALLQLDSSPSSHACSNTLPTGHRPIGARAIINAEMIMENAEMQKCRNCNGEMRQWCGGAWSTVGTDGRRVVGGLGVLWGRTQADWCVQEAGMCGELCELMGLLLG